MPSMRYPNLIAFVLICLLLLAEVVINVLDHSILSLSLLAHSILLVVVMFKPSDDKAEALFFRSCAVVAFSGVLFVTLTHVAESFTSTHGEHDVHNDHFAPWWILISSVDAVSKIAFVVLGLVPPLGVWKPLQVILHTIAPTLMIIHSTRVLNGLVFKDTGRTEASLALLVIIVSVIIIFPTICELKPYIFADAPPFFKSSDFKEEINKNFPGMHCTHLHVYRLWPNSFEAILTLEITVSKDERDWSDKARIRYEEAAKFVRSALVKGGAKKVFVEPKFVDTGSANAPWRGCIESSCQQTTGCCPLPTPTANNAV